MLPSFNKMPMDLSIRAGATARLECAAVGHPSPQIAWQKDGGTDFPAARERRMHVMPEDDVFFIVDVKTEDIGVYSCTAQNTAGAISANATLTVLGEKQSHSTLYLELSFWVQRLISLIDHSNAAAFCSSAVLQKHLPSCGPSWTALWPRVKLPSSSA